MAQRTSKPSSIGVVLLAGGLALAVCASAHAQPGGRLYRYVDENGRVHYTDRPQDVSGRPVDQLNRQGMVIKHLEGPPTPEQIAEREAAKKKKQEDEQREREQKRKDEMLRGRYASANDIDLARKDALTGLEQAIRGAEARIADISRRESRAKAEAARFPADKVPPEVQEDLAGMARETAAQRETIARKQSEIAATNARYDEDKSRYLEMTGGGAPTRADAAQPGPAK